MKTICTEKYNICIGDESIAELNRFLSAVKHSSVFILVDENTKKHCLPLLKKIVTQINNLRYIQIKSGEKNKNIKTCIKIWKELSKQNADRGSLLINLGGGVITDMGGFAASAYKRGIDFIHIPTTLLAQADASIGGKTGIDFFDFKNQIGAFAFPKAVFIVPSFLKTLDKKHLLSGFAEVIKHALIADKNYWQHLKIKVEEKKIKVKDNSPSSSSSSLIFFSSFGNLSDLDTLIEHSIKIKNEIVSKDPFENGLRKALNFGHTIGHAIESASLEKDKKPLSHGESIAMGMICEAYLSRKRCGLSGKEMDDIASFIPAVFNLHEIRHPIKNLIRLMQQDKKNRGSEINFTLLSAIGKAEINNPSTDGLIEESIRFFNDLRNTNF